MARADSTRTLMRWLAGAHARGRTPQRDKLGAPEDWPFCTASPLKVFLLRVERLLHLKHLPALLQQSRRGGHRVERQLRRQLGVALSIRLHRPAQSAAPLLQAADAPPAETAG
eukprot:scaffold8279_cov116-Isochrysis_galbana.AAC.8